jgi:phosphoglycerate kinase
MTAFRMLDHADVKGQRVLVRADLNVPVEHGIVTDATRIERMAPAITEIADKGAKVILLSHFGRPKGRDPKDSLKPVAAELAHILKRPVKFVNDCIGKAAERAVAAMKPGDLLCLENTRFHPGEEKNDPAFAASLAKLGEIFVNDAFSAAHRAHASTEGVAHLLPSYAGRLMQAELEALASALTTPVRPVMAIVGGSKVSTKLDLLGNLVAKVDVLVIGGAMANTFLAAEGVGVGTSLQEADMHATALEIVAKAKAAGCAIVLPVDAIVAGTLAPGVATEPVAMGAVPADQMILDIGPRTVAEITGRLAAMKTLVWNGPVGAFETPPFDAGTTALAKAIGAATQAGALRSVAGGGDTVSALRHAGELERMSYVSAAGGAFLEWLEGKTLPGVAVLES